MKNRIPYRRIFVRGAFGFLMIRDKIRPAKNPMPGRRNTTAPGIWYQDQHFEYKIHHFEYKIQHFEYKIHHV